MDWLGYDDDGQLPLEEIPLTLAAIFLPGFILGLMSCWHRGILKTFIAHPSILLMPTFTHFAFASSTKWCKRSQKEEVKEEDEEEEEGERQEKTNPYIAFSSKATNFNLLLATLGVVFIYLRNANSEEYLFRLFRLGDIVFLIFILVPILGVLFTVLSLVLNSARPTCCRCNCSSGRPNSSCSSTCPPPSCCCSCFTLPSIEYGALVTSRPFSHFVLGANGKPQPVPEVNVEETEMADNAKEIENQEEELVELAVNQARDNQDLEMMKV